MYIPLTFEGALQKCLFASGGYEGFFISGSQQWKYHWFTGSIDNLEVQKGTIDNVQIYVIGGGGGGASDSSGRGGAGGGGGVNYTMTGRLFAGTYQVRVGRGGAGAGAPNNVGDSGVSSSFIGSNLNMVAGGGQGGNWGTGTGQRGGTSGNGFLGALNTGTTGGGGGGATVAATTLDGGVGITAYIANYSHNFGCGGGGARDNASAGSPGYSCSDFSYGAGGKGGAGNAGANFYGMGGGGSDGGLGANGGSGSVIIQYPIYDYCTNNYNESGSCKCSKLTFDSTDNGSYRPDVSASYIYTPCGGNSVVSGSVTAYYPITVCATSGTFYSGPTGDNQYIYGFLTGSIPFSECSTGSVCGTIPLYTATCSSSYTTYFNTLDRPNGIYYVPRNGTQITLNNMTQQSGSYICASNNYPTGSTTPNFVAVPGVKCFNLRYQRTITPASGQQILYWYDCSNTLRSQTFTYPGTNTFDFTASFAISGPWMTTNFASWTTIQYLSTAGDYTGSVPACGCP